MDALPFSLRQLQYAVAVADTGGFRRAAERVTSRSRR
jgi:DNA-binding transcriptional LysR family regulator